MHWLQTHLRNTLLAGAMAAVPIGIVVWAAVWLEVHTQPLTKPFGFHFPGLGVLLALVGLYALGWIVTSLVGSFLLGLADKALSRVPGLNLLYRAWKDILVLPASKESMLRRVVLVPQGDGLAAQIGFTNGEPLPGDERRCCVFIPNVPNPLSGRLTVVPRSACVFLEMGTEDAFKLLLSSGNHLPNGWTADQGRQPS